MQLITKQQVIDLTRPVIMGILNVTPDSFSDGGRYALRDHALRQAEQMLRDGAKIIDIGGESTRPGAEIVTEPQELERVIPIIEALRANTDATISIDSYKPNVMRAAVTAGADIINDVKGLSEPGALELAAALQVPVCIMHMQGEPQTMQHAPVYENVVNEVSAFFEQRVQQLVAHGLAPSKIILDPGFGFGKTLQHNYQLLKQLDQFQRFGCPLLVGVSRKSMIGQLTGKPAKERMVGSVTAAVLAAQRGAQILRVHDVAQMQEALTILNYYQFEV